MTTNKRIQPWRWSVKVVQAIVVLGLPFLKVQGESALRFDIPSLTLHFFGASIWMDEFFLVLVAILFISFLIVTLTILFGRIWCGWLCPQTVIIDLTRFVDRMPFRGTGYRVASLLAVLAISAVLAASLIWYFVSPYEFLERFASGKLGPVIGWSWLSLTVITALNFAFLRHTFCTTVCPYAKMQGALFDDRTLVIAPDPDRMDECMHCDACVRVCPVQIDVRQGLSGACINCAECIDACARQMDRRQRRSLIGYRFGSSGRLLRRSVLLAGTLTAGLLALFLVLLMERTPLDIEIGADPITPPRLTQEGALVNSYILSVSNRSEEDQEIILYVEGGAPDTLYLHPDRFVLERGEHRRIALTVSARTGGPQLYSLIAQFRSDPRVRKMLHTKLQSPW
jgi:cytochrome c oxidase accessory protein FixG